MNLYKLALEIQGGVDSAFGDSISVAQKHLNGLEKEIKAVADGQKQIGPLQEVYVKMSTDAANATSQISSLNKTVSDLTAYKKQRNALVENGHAVLAARREVRALEEQYKNTKLPEHAAKLKTAKNETNRLEKEYTKNRASLKKLDEKLVDTGVDTKDLDGSFAKLREQIGKATEEQKKFRTAMTSFAAYKANLIQAGKNFKKFGADLFSGAKLFMKGAAVLGGAAFMSVNSMAKQGDEAAKLARQLQMGTESLQEFQFVAKMSGVKNFNGTIEKMNLNIARAVNGEGQAVKGIKELGISAKQLQKMGPEKSLVVLADKLNKIQDPAKKARIAFALWGTESTKMLEMLGGGSEGLKKLREEARKSGNVITDEMSRQAEEYNNKRDMMLESLKGVRNIVGAELLPVFIELFSEGGKSIQGIQPAIREFAKELGEIARDIVPQIKIFFGHLKTGVGIFWQITKVVANMVGGFGNLMTIMALLPFGKAAFSGGKLVISIFRLGRSFMTLLPAISAVKGAMFLFLKSTVIFIASNPITFAIGVAVAAIGYLIYKIWKNWDWLKSEASQIVAKVKGTWDGLGESFAGIKDTIKMALVGVKDVILGPFMAAFDSVKGGWDSVKAAFGFGGKKGANLASVPVAAHARGGRVSSKTLSTLAERGSEFIVPTAAADRSHGLSALAQAARALNVPLGRGGDGEITFSPVFHITGNNAPDIANEVLNRVRDALPSLLREVEERMERVSYASI